MIDARQQAYLDAMDIDVWLLRQQPLTQASVPAATPAAKSPGLKLGPGGGGVLLLCAVDVDSASRLANDIARALGNNPVWAWPHADAACLSDAIDENLFTTVAIFGDELASQFFEGELPASVNSANLVLLPSMQNIRDSADARQQLWNAICRSGMVSVGDQ